MPEARPWWTRWDMQTWGWAVWEAVQGVVHNQGDPHKHAGFLQWRECKVRSTVTSTFKTTLTNMWCSTTSPAIHAPRHAVPATARRLQAHGASKRPRGAGPTALGRRQAGSSAVGADGTVQAHARVRRAELPCSTRHLGQGGRRHEHRPDSRALENELRRAPVRYPFRARPSGRVPLHLRALTLAPTFIPLRLHVKPPGQKVRHSVSQTYGK